MRQATAREFEGVNYALWPEASRQGEVAGANAAGDVSVLFKRQKLTA